MDTDFPSNVEDDWDMSPRREAAVMVDMPTSFEPMEPAAPDRPITTIRGKLSPAEIEALLRPDLSDMDPLPPPTPPPAATARAIPELEPHQPAPASDARPLAEQARRIAARLSLAFRESCGLRAAALATGAGDGDFESGLSTHAQEKGRAIACFAGPDGEIRAMLSLSAPLASALIETACGGKPGPYSPRALTPLDAALLESLVRPLGAAVAKGLTFATVETDTEFASVLAAPGAATIFDFDVRVETERLTARLILADDDLFDAEEPAPSARQLLLTAPETKAAPVTAVLTARIASLSVPLSRLSDLKAGSTLLLGLPADQPVELLSGGRDGPVMAEGQIGRKGNRMALRITKRAAALR